PRPLASRRSDAPLPLAPSVHCPALGTQGERPGTPGTHGFEGYGYPGAADPRSHGEPLGGRRHRLDLRGGPGLAPTDLAPARRPSRTTRNPGPHRPVTTRVHFLKLSATG